MACFVAVKTTFADISVDDEDDGRPKPDISRQCTHNARECGGKYGELCDRQGDFDGENYGDDGVAV